MKKGYLLNFTVKISILDVYFYLSIENSLLSVVYKIYTTYSLHKPIK